MPCCSTCITQPARRLEPSVAPLCLLLSLARNGSNCVRWSNSPSKPPKHRASPREQRKRGETEAKAPSLQPRLKSYLSSHANHCEANKSRRVMGKETHKVTCTADCRELQSGASMLTHCRNEACKLSPRSQEQAPLEQSSQSLCESASLRAFASLYEPSQVYPSLCKLEPLIQV